MIVDFHSHLYPREFASAGVLPPIIFDVDRLRAQQDEAGVNLSVISNPMIVVAHAAMDLTTVEALTRYHDFAADLVARHLDHFVALAGCVPFGSDAHLREMERAVRDCGLRGVVVNSSVNGEYLDSPRAEAFYALVTELDVPVFVHPPAQTVGREFMDVYRLVEMVGRPMDTTLSLVRLVLAGVLERHPALRLVGAHMGGAITLLPGRLDFGYALRHDPSYGPWGPDVLAAPPGRYVRQLYVDTMGFHPPGVMCAVETLGAGHVLLGSDHPPVNIPLKRSVDLVRELPLSEEDRAGILGGNVLRLLGLAS